MQRVARLTLVAKTTHCDWRSVLDLMLAIGSIVGSVACNSILNNESLSPGNRPDARQPDRDDAGGNDTDSSTGAAPVAGMSGATAESGQGAGDAAGGSGRGAAGSTEPPCVANAVQCVSATKQRTCLWDETWGSEAECPYVCIENRCGGECKPGMAECTSITQRRACDSRGAWTPASSCTNACVDGVCTGDCVPGSLECATETSVRRCGDDGRWDEAAPCSSGQCKDRDCSPLMVFGRSSLESGQEAVQKDTLIGIELNIPVACSLVGIGIVVAAVPGPVHAYFGLYTDFGSAPGNRLALSAEVELHEGLNEFELPKVLLSAGTYWILFVLDQYVSVATSADTTESWMFAPSAYGDPPLSFGFAFTPTEAKSPVLYVQVVQL